MSDTTPNLRLPYLAAAQAQKHVTLNEALRALDPIVKLAIQDHLEGAPTELPQEGQCWIIGSPATGEWEGREGEIAAFMDGAWRFITALEGWTAWSCAAGRLLVFDGTNWQPIAPSDGLFTEIGLSATPDTVNPFAARLPNALFTCVEAASGGDGSVRIKLNRETDNDTASVQFQTGWSGRAEIGLVGDNRFRLKTSADGTAFADAICVDVANGHLGIGTVPNASDPLSIRKDQAASTQFTVANLNTAAGASAAFRLNASNGHYLNFQLYGSGNVYAYSNASMIFGTYAAAPLRLRTDTQDRMTVHADGRISIGTATASSQLSVNGAVRVGQYASGALPSAATSGTGAIIYVTDLVEGPSLAISDGTGWRQLALGAIIE